MQSVNVILHRHNLPLKLMKSNKFAILAAMVALLCASCCRVNFVKVVEGKFNGAGVFPYFIGTNFWYGTILASDGEGGDINRLTSELDNLKASGITNLRILVGADGPDGVPTRVSPTLQKAPGVYNDTLLRGLDRLMAELGKRDMKAVLYLNNSWEWSGGYGMYLEWAGEGKALIPAEVGYPVFMESVSRFVTCDKAKELFADHVRFIVSRTNTVTGKPYSQDPAIFSWQIGNEPRCFNSDPAVKHAFADWMWEVAYLIKSIDTNHMVSSGSEGLWGCENDPELFEKIHSCPNIDYINIHIWPYNWGWVSEESLLEDVPYAIEQTDAYIQAHMAVAEKYRKPIVIEEFGFPRDGFLFSKDTTTRARDLYYSHLFDCIRESAAEGGLLAGVNFWAWGGYASQSPDHIYWQSGDDYCGDPAQEQQGLNSVYAGDTTVGIIREAVSRINGSYKE